MTKVFTESPTFLQQIQGDIYGSIHPPCRPFRYFMVLIDASIRWSYVSLLPTRNLAFAKLHAQIIILEEFPTLKTALEEFPTLEDCQKQILEDCQKQILEEFPTFSLGLCYKTCYIEPAV